MTTLDVTPRTARPTTASRGVAVMRMHLADRITMVVLPTSILATVLLVNWVVWLFVPRDGRQTGGAACIWFFLLVVAMFAVVRGLPFALGMGASRRAFTIGTELAGLVLALGYGTLILVLQVVERVTDGWGRHGHLVYFSWFRGTAWPVVWLVCVVSIFAAYAVGALVAAVWSRWGTAGLAVAGPAVVLVVGGLLVLVLWRGWGHDVLHWFARLTPATTTGWCAVLAVVCSLATWGVLRRVRA